MSSKDRVLRKPSEEVPMSIFGDEFAAPNWADNWWGLPAFTMGDARPQYRIAMNFMTIEDIKEFAKITGASIIPGSTTSAWYPPQERLGAREFYWRGKPSQTRYPVYIPSKGRIDIATTPQLLRQAGIKFSIVVEPQEADAYRAKFGGDNILVLPFSNLGLGSIPARNWIWEHAKAAGAPWHWIIDDNIRRFYRTHNNRRLIVTESSAPLRVVEDMTDRYDNLAFTGLSHIGFCPDRAPMSPYTFNTRVYSTTLINTALPYRWRGKYNEDTDLCLRALKDGYGTILLRAFLMDKAPTSRGDGKTGMEGGNNTIGVYAAGDHRLKFAQSLEKQHPDCVKVVWKFNRWHHEVDYTIFKGNKIKLRSGVTPTKDINEYELELIGKDGGPIE